MKERPTLLIALAPALAMVAPTHGQHPFAAEATADQVAFDLVSPAGPCLGTDGTRQVLPPASVDIVQGRV